MYLIFNSRQGMVNVLCKRSLVLENRNPCNSSSGFLSDYFIVICPNPYVKWVDGVVK